MGRPRWPSRETIHPRLRRSAARGNRAWRPAEDRWALRLSLVLGLPLLRGRARAVLGVLVVLVVLVVPVVCPAVLVVLVVCPAVLAVLVASAEAPVSSTRRRCSNG